MPRYSHRSRTRRRNRGRFGPLFKLLCLIALIVALTGGGHGVLPGGAGGGGNDHVRESLRSLEDTA